MASASRAFLEPDPVRSLLDDVLSLSSHREFKDDIMLFWLERMQITGSDGRLAAVAGSPLLEAVKELG